jgi:transposase
MARPYSEGLRGRVVEAVMGGATCRVAAARYQVSVSFVVKLMQRWRGSGSVAAQLVGGQRPYRLAEHAELVRELVTAEPDITLEELRRRLAGQGVQVGRSSADRFLISLGLTRKKDAACRRAGPGRCRPSPNGVACGSADHERRQPGVRR